jgi:hypothetical protein
MGLLQMPVGFAGLQVYLEKFNLSVHYWTQSCDFSIYNDSGGVVCSKLEKIILIS